MDARCKYDGIGMVGNSLKIYSFFEDYALDKLNSQNLDTKNLGYMAGHMCAALSVLNNANIHI